MCICLLAGINAYAYDAYIDGIYYNFSGDEATVTYQKYQNYSYISDYSASVIIPESVSYNGKTYTVTSIGKYAFSGCTGLTSITIPNSLTTIEDRAFEYCGGLISVTIGSNVLSIGTYAFPNSVKKVIWLTNTPPQGYKGLNGVVNYVANEEYTGLSNVMVYPQLSSIFEVRGVKYVPISFSERICDAIDCNYDKSAEHININDTVSYKGIIMNIKSIKPYACYMNQYIKDVVLNNDGDVCEYAFYGCNGLTLVNLFNKGNINAFAFAHSNIGEKLTINNSGCLETSSFSNINGSFTANINNTGRISDSAFYESSGLIVLEIGNNVTEIGNDAFKSCSSLQTATLGNGIITSIGSEAFYGCSSLQRINIPNGVTSLGAYAFQNCSQMTSAKIGTGIKSILTSTFSGCSKLTEMQIGKNVKSINENAFYACRSLSNITIPKAVKSIGDYTFQNCTALKNVMMEEEASEINLGSNGSSPLFVDCPLDSIFIGRNISYPTSENKGYSPFYRNTSLRTVVITDKETEIPLNEFYGCTNLQSFAIGDGVTSFGDWAFSGCSSLKSLSFGSQLSSIGKEAFSDCSSVTRIVSKAVTPPSCGKQALNDINKWECTLYVPEGSLSSYQGAEQWKEFIHMEVIISSVPATGISLNQYSLLFNAANQSATLTAIVTPSNATNKKVTWSSSNTDVATVSDEGVVTSKANGTTVITAKTTDGTDLTATCDVTVAIPVLATGIALNQTTLSFNDVNQTATLIATVTPSNATNKNVTWSSSNTDVATVSDSGVVTSKANGTAVITAKTTDGTNLTATCEVTVAIPVLATGISLNQNTLSFNAANQTATLIATVTPSNATNKKVTWSSSNTDVAIVSDEGVVTSKANGTTVITAKTTDGTDLTATCEVIVAIPVLATGISLNQTTLSFNDVNQTATLIATVTPSNATNNNVTWSSSNTDVATVSDAGVVTSKANGTTVITAKTTDGTNLTATCDVIVNSSPNIIFADTKVKEICVANWDINGDGELSKEEAAVVTNLGTVFKGNKSITSFEELQYFTGLTAIWNDAFYNCSGLTSVTIPNSVTNIGEDAFYGCSGLGKVIVPDIAAWCGISFGNDSANPLFCGHHLYSNEFKEITDLVIPNKVTSISNYAFCGCSGLTSITIPIVGVTEFKVGMKVKITGKLMKYVKNGEVTPEIMKADVVVLEQGEGGGGQGGDDSGGQGGGGDPVTDLTNGDFENWVSDSEPAGWKSASSASNATLSKSTDARGGNFSCMVAAPGTQNKRLATQEMTLEAGSYTFSYYAKSTTGDLCQTRGGYVPVNADGSVGAYTYKKTYTDLNNSGWTLVSYDFELSSKTTLCLVVMNPKGSSYSVSQDILVDDATLTKNNIRKAAATGSSPDDDIIPITCAEAIELTNMMADGETSTETYSITGYITEVIGNVSRNQQSFWMADTKDGGKVLEAYWANLPESVTNIGYKAFSSCKGLKEIYCFAEKTPQVDTETFYDIQPKEILLVVPDVAVEQYKAHPIWSQFWIETPTGVRLAPAISHGNDIRYDIQGRKLNKPQKGINIIRYSDGTTKKILVK